MKIEEPAIDSHLRDPALMPPVHLQGRRYITCFDPATAWHLGTYVADNEEEIGQKIRLAATAQQSFRHSSFADRRKIVRSLKKWLIDNQETCAKVAARDTGKTRESVSFVRERAMLRYTGQCWTRRWAKSSPPPQRWTGLCDMASIT